MGPNLGPVLVPIVADWSDWVGIMVTTHFGTGYTHQELFVEKTVDWMQAKQVLGCVDEMVNIYPYLKVPLSDVIWRQIYLNIRAVSSFTTCALDRFIKKLFLDFHLEPIVFDGGIPS